MTQVLALGATWGGSVAASVAVHLGAAVLILASLDPHITPDQPLPKSELRIETQQVAQSNATPQAATGAQAAAASAKGNAASEGVVPHSRAQPAAPKPDRLAAAMATAPATKPSAAPAQKLTSAAAPAATTKPSAPQSATLKPATATPVAARPSDLAATTLPAAPGTATDLAAAAPDATPAPQAQPDAQPAPVAPATGDRTVAAPASGDRMVAALAFSGTDAQIDPVSLNAIASFMQPGDTAAQSDETHDALTTILTSVPCARLQAEFNPETGSLDLRGHVPDAALKGPVLAALQAQLGTAIKVNDAMLILPRPQCGALSGIAEVGLPQSQDQNTNPRLIGADAQARAYDYTAGQTLVLDLAAPDYDAYVYVDYFAADGSVIHLVPNDTVPLRLRPAKSAMRVGAPDADEAFLNITIGPPYGQEIAAAFAASAPLYDGTRPLSEPAGPYLDFLKTQTAAARAANPDFKGEWVYFFVSTRE